jgi:hypothetical protein
LTIKKHMPSGSCLTGTSNALPIASAIARARYAVLPWTSITLILASPSMFCCHSRRRWSGVYLYPHFLPLSLPNLIAQEGGSISVRPPLALFRFDGRPSRSVSHSSPSHGQGGGVVGWAVLWSVQLVDDLGMETPLCEDDSIWRGVNHESYLEPPPYLVPFFPGDLQIVLMPGFHQLVCRPIWYVPIIVGGYLPPVYPGFRHPIFRA